MLSVNFSYAALLSSRFDAVMKACDCDRMEAAWNIVASQQNRQDVLSAAALFYKHFPKNPRRVTLYFSDGPQEFGASQIECLKKESPSLEKMLADEGRIALTRAEFLAAINGHPTSLEVAYYLHIPRLIEGAEDRLGRDINRLKALSDFESGLEFFEKAMSSLLKNCPFISSLIENELADLFGCALLMHSKRPEAVSSMIDRYKEKKICAISLSFESDYSRSIVKEAGKIDSLRWMKVNSFSVKDIELAFPRHVTHIELINTADITVDTLKALPVTVIFLKLLGTRFKGSDLQFLPPSLIRLVLKEVFCGLTPVIFPSSLRHLELDACIDFGNEWLKSLPELSTLIVRSCPNITGRALLTIPSSLTHVEMIGSRVQEEDLGHLPEGLETLLLPDSPLNPSSFIPQVTKLDLSGTEIGDGEVAKLPDKLIFLNLNRCKITGKTLSRFQHLTHLYLEGCPILHGCLDQIPRSITHFSLSIEIQDEEASLMPLKLVEVFLNGASLTPSGWIRLPRTLVKIQILGLKILKEEVQRYLPNGCSIQA